MRTKAYEGETFGLCQLYEHMRKDGNLPSARGKELKMPCFHFIIINVMSH